MKLPSETITRTPALTIIVLILISTVPILSFLYGIHFQKQKQKYYVGQTPQAENAPTIQQQPSTFYPPAVILKYDFMTGLNYRLESENTSVDGTNRILQDVLRDKIESIQLTEDYKGLVSTAETEQMLLDEFSDSTMTVSPVASWNVDFPIDYAGVLHYENGTRGIFGVAGHRVGFQDSTGESWYFEWDTKLTTDTTQPTGACAGFMDTLISLDPQFHTDPMVSGGCNNVTFEVLDHEYAKDNRFVYYHPMPNANNMTVIVENADPATFQVSETCSEAADKNHLYQLGKIVEPSNASYIAVNCF